MFKRFYRRNRTYQHQHAIRQFKANQEILQRQLASRELELQVIHDLGNQLDYSFSYIQMTKLIVSHLSAIIPYDIAGMMVDGQTIIAAHRPSTPALKQQLVKEMSTLLEDLDSKVQIAQDIQYINEFIAPIGQPQVLQQIGSLLQVPLVVGPAAETIGVIALAAETKECFTEQHVRLLYTVAHHASATVHRLKTLLIGEEERLHNLVASLPIGVLLVDGNRRLVHINHVGIELLTAIIATLPNRQCSGASHFDCFFEHLEKTVSPLQIANDTAQRAIEFTITPMNAGPQDGGAIIILQDITAREKHHEMLQEGRRLRLQLEKEKELAEFRSNFFTMVIHDIGTPLSTISLLASKLLHFHTHLAEEQFSATARLILQNIEGMSQLMKDILLIERNNHGSSYFQPELGNIDAVLRALCYDLQDSYTDEFTICYCCNLPNVTMEFDQHLIQRLFNNLLYNAIKYSPNGGEINVILEATEQTIVVKVCDQGIGIPEEDQARIFHIFQRASNTGKALGSGLGLMIAKQVVEFHQGAINFTSVINRGTIFEITLPRRLSLHHLHAKNGAPKRNGVPQSA